MHRCIPEASFTILEETYFFFLAFFFAGILFSSHRFNIRHKQRRSALSASMYSDCHFPCQEKSDNDARQPTKHRSSSSSKCVEDLNCSDSEGSIDDRRTRIGTGKRMAMTIPTRLRTSQKA
jgi:hypothetical protein